MPDRDAEQPVVMRSGAQRPIEAVSGRAWATEPRVDRPRVLVGPWVWFSPSSDPFRRADQAVEVGVTDDRFDRPDPGDELGCHHLGTRAVLGLGREYKPRITSVASMLGTVVVIDPSCE